MNTTIKTALIVLFCFVMALIIVLTFTIHHITESGDQEIDKFHQQELERIKHTLKNYVDMADTIIDTHYNNARDKKFLEKYYGRRLISIIDVAETVLNSKAEAVKKGELTVAEAQTQAMQEIKQIRYDNGDGYVWIIDTALPPKMIMHPIEPSLDDQVLDDPKYNTANGKKQNLFVAAVELCETHGKGFVDYLWPKETEKGVEEDVLQLAHVRLFPEWKWVIGSAVFVDEAGLDAIDKSLNDIRQLRYNNGKGGFWIMRTEPELKLLVYPENPSLEGQILEEGKLKALLASYIKTVETKNGSGFIKYSWPEQRGGLTIESQKWAYVKRYEALNWIVSTSIDLDNVEEGIIEKKGLINGQIKNLIIQILLVSIVIILLVSLLSYMLREYFPKLKSFNKQPPIETCSQGRKAVSQPTLVSSQSAKTTPILTQDSETMLRTDDCIKMVQEISKTLITEQTKLLAKAINGQGSGEQHSEHQMTHEVKNLANQTYQTIEEMKKIVEGKPVASIKLQNRNEALNTDSNTVVSNLNNMVG
jgi:signal transduction histidine kinase